MNKQPNELGIVPIDKPYTCDICKSAKTEYVNALEQAVCDTCALIFCEACCEREPQFETTRGMQLCLQCWETRYD